MFAESKLRQMLSRLRRRLNWVAFGEASALALTVLLVALSLTVVTASALGPQKAAWALAFFASGMAGALYLGWRHWLRPLRARRSDEAMARWVESARGDLSASLITAVQLASMPDLVNQPLAEASLERTTASLEDVALDPLIRKGRLVWLSATAASVFVVALTLALLFPSALETARANLFDPFDPNAHAPQIETVEHSFVVTGISLEIQAPTYTGLKPRFVESPRGRIEAIAGATTRIVGQAALPSTRAWLTLESDPDGRWPATLKGAGLVKIVLRIGTSDRYRFSLLGQDGRVHLESRWREIVATEDAVPTVEFLRPPADIEAHAGDQIPLLAEARDDFGIEKLELVIEGPKGITRRPFGGRPRGRTLRAEDVLSVDDLRLLPGDAATLYIEATDGNDASGPGIGRSASRRVFMANPEAEQERLLGALEVLIDLMIDLLADRLESPVTDRLSPNPSQILGWHDAIVTKQTVILNKLESALRSLAQDTLRREEVATVLRRTLDELEAILSSETRQLSRIRDRGFNSPRLSVLRALLDSVNRDGIEATETAIFALKEIVDRSRQEKVLNRGREMLTLQNELHDLLSQLKENGDPELAAKAVRHLDRLEQNLRDMESQMHKLAERVPYENQNATHRQSDTSIDMQSMKDKLAEAKRLIREGKIDEAMKLLDGLNTQTQQLMASLNDQFKTGRPMSAKGQEGLSQVQNALRKLQSGQQEVLERTGEALREQQEEMARAFEERLDELVRDAQKLSEKLESVPDSPLHSSDERVLKELRKTARSLAPGIKSGEFETARRQADSLSQESSKLESEVGQSEARELDLKRSRRLREAMKGLGDSSKKAKELAKKLSELEGELSRLSGSPGGRKEQQRFKRLGKDQNALRKRTGRLQKAVRQLEGEIPGIGKHLGPDLEDANRSMENAGHELKRRKNGAKRHQRDALDKLGKALKGLEQKLKQSPHSESQSGINDPREKVAIPDADAYDVPKEFREELLKAMKERAPKRFKREIERYYEELVQ